MALRDQGRDRDSSAASRVVPLCLVAIACHAACGGGHSSDPPDADGDGDGDGDDDGDAGADGFVLEPPTRPELPVLTPCPLGWRLVPAEDPADPYGVETCDPWPASGRADCAADEAHFPGEPGCSRIGTPCPEGEWPEGLPADVPVLHVRAGGAAGGVGSREDPFGTFVDALAAASPGTVLALSKGTFEEPVWIETEGVTLWGACVAETTIACSTPEARTSVIRVAAAGVAVRNLRVTGERVAIAARGDGVTLDLEDVLVEGALIAGINVAGTQLTGRTVVVRGTRDPTYGVGIDVYEGGHAELGRVSVERCLSVGIAVSGAGSSLRLADAAVWGTLGVEYGIGLSCFEGGQAEVERSVFEDNVTYGLTSDDPGGRLQATDVVVRGTRSRPTDQGEGQGLVARWGGSAEVRRALFEGNRSYGLQAGVTEGVEDAALSVTDLVVLDTAPTEADGLLGMGLVVFDGYGLTLHRALVRGSSSAGVQVQGVGTERDLEDLVVLGTSSGPVPVFGHGLVVADGAHAMASRVALVKCQNSGLFVAGEGTEVDVEDLLVVDTLAGPDGGGGVGIGSYGGAHVDAAFFRVTGSALAGVQLAVGGVLDDGVFIEYEVGGTVTARDGEVAFDTIGVNVQFEGFDPDRDFERVFVHDNGSDWDFSDIPVPTAHLPWEDWSDP